MSEVTRHHNEIRELVLDAEWEVARTEWMAAAALVGAGGEQPDAQINSEPGALRGGFPLSETVKENK